MILKQTKNIHGVTEVNKYVISPLKEIKEKTYWLHAANFTDKLLNSRKKPQGAQERKRRKWKLTLQVNKLSLQRKWGL